MVIAGPNFGFGVDTVLTCLRMIVRGVFDEFPDLKIILGHYGEGLPFFIDRVDCGHRNAHNKPKPEMGPGSNNLTSYYLKKNVWVTTSGNFSPPAFDCTRESIGLDRILLGTDYPFEDMTASVQWLEGLSLSSDDLSSIWETNASSCGIVAPARA